MAVTLLSVVWLTVGAVAGLMAWDRGRLSRRLVSATRAIRDHELHIAALSADKQVLERSLGVADQIADWRAFHDDLTALLTPPDFMTVAESTGLIGALGGRLIEEACRQFEHWRAEHPELSRISVNLAHRQLAEPAALAGLTRAVEAAGLEPHHLCLDVTETALLDDDPGTQATLHRLTGQGFGLGIDDFGTGSASLTCTRRVPADTIKIDRSYVAGVTTSASDRAVVAAVVSR